MRVVVGDMAFNWTCPHCDRDQAVAGDRRWMRHLHIDIDGLAEGSVGIKSLAIGCANPKCRKITLHVEVGTDYMPHHNYIRTDEEPLLKLYLLPRGTAKPLPAYIPPAIAEDYFEACLIRDDSPKASATLARRCLQGMIRDFCGISKTRLIDEINELRAAIAVTKAPPGVTVESVNAIDHVRGVGNIGAHMEADVGMIIPVDADEAQVLISLIEMLIREWYVERHDRAERLAAIEQLGVRKGEAVGAVRAAIREQKALAAPQTDDEASA